jgi:hypothetical protein
MGIVVPGACQREIFRGKPQGKKKRRGNRTQKGDISNGVRKGTFLTGFDSENLEVDAVPGTA